MKAVAVLISLAALSTLAAADIHSQLEGLDKKICAAMMNRDVNAFTKVMKGGVTSDFKYVESGRSMGFDKMVAGMKMGLAGFTKMKKVEDKVLNLKVTGNTATAQTEHTMIGMVPGPDHKPHEMEFSGVSSDTFRLEGGTWKMASMIWVKQSMTMDGKAMMPQGMGAGH